MWDSYYTNTKDAKYHSNLKLLPNEEGKNKYVIELGCGAGRDTIYLLKMRI